MRLGIVLPQHDAGRAEVLDAARRAEEAGLDSVWAYDNLWPKPGFSTLLECWTALSAAAVVTERVTLGPLVLRVTLRRPELAAHIVRSLSGLAPGRVVVAMGTGDTSTRDELVASGYGWPEFAERLTLLDRQIELLRREVPGVPLWIGGTGPRILSLLPLADGWSYWGPVHGYADAAARAKRAAGSRKMQTCWGWSRLDRAGLQELRALDVDHAVLAVGAGNYAERIDWLASMRGLI